MPNTSPVLTVQICGCPNCKTRGHLKNFPEVEHPNDDSEAAGVVEVAGEEDVATGSAIEVDPVHMEIAVKESRAQEEEEEKYSREGQEKDEKNGKPKNEEVKMIQNEYSFSFFKNSRVEGEMNSLENVTRLDDYTERPSLGFALLDKEKHKKPFKEFSGEISKLGQRYEYEPPSEEAKFEDLKPV